MPDPQAGPPPIGARHRWTPRFVDPLVERTYRSASADPARRRLRWAAALNIPAWIGGATLAPCISAR
jgi:hypothetical protein